MRTCMKMLAVGVLVLGVGQRAVADIHFLTATLDGAQETPPVATPATGSATMTLDDVTLQFTMTGTFQDLIGTSNNAHVHGPADFGEGPAGVLFGITFDNGVNSGSFSFNGVISQAHADEILAGMTYINIHSTFRPGGEIRGQIVPEPSALSLLGLGLMGAAVRQRR